MPKRKMSSPKCKLDIKAFKTAIKLCKIFADHQTTSTQLLEIPTLAFIRFLNQTLSCLSMPLCSYNKYDQSQGGYEEAVMMGDPPAKEYNTYMMQVFILILVMMMMIMSILLKK